jgi:hypothetical protein
MAEKTEWICSRFSEHRVVARAMQGKIDRQTRNSASGEGSPHRI